MNQYRPLFGDTGSNAVCALNVLGPNASEPNPPALKIVSPVFITPVMNRHSIFVAQQDDVPLLSHNRVKAINLLPRLRDHVRNRFLRSRQLVLGDYVRRGPAFGVDMIICQAPAPLVGNFFCR